MLWLYNDLASNMSNGLLGLHFFGTSQVVSYWVQLHLPVAVFSKIQLLWHAPYRSLEPRCLVDS